MARHLRTAGALAAAAALGCAALLGAVPSVARPIGAAAGEPRPAYRLADARITEASGIAPGLASAGIDYVENDSGDVNRIFAVNARTGTTAATVTVRGARNVDWEDIAVAPDPAGTPSVWIADVGDNAAVRDEIQVYRVAEPHVTTTDRDRRIRTRTADVWRLRYPDGPADAESLAVGPAGTAYLVTKSLGASVVYRMPARPDADRVQPLRRVGAIAFAPTGTDNPFGVAGQLSATSAAISADGAVFVVRTYSDAYVWPVRHGDVAAALKQRPSRLALPEQPQGEGIGLRGTSLLLDSEGVHSAVYEVPLPVAASRPSPSPSPSTEPIGPSVPTVSSASSGHAGRGWILPLAVAGAAAVLLAASLLLRRRSR
jgi:hypothetical protein